MAYITHTEIEKRTTDDIPNVQVDYSITGGVNVIHVVIDRFVEEETETTPKMYCANRKFRMYNGRKMTQDEIDAAVAEILKG